MLLEARVARPGFVRDEHGLASRRADAIEGVFVRAGSQVLQLEVMGPESAQHVYACAACRMGRAWLVGPMRKTVA